MSHCTIPIHVRDVAVGGVTRVAEPLRAVLGFSEADLAERHLLDWIHPDDRRTVEDAMRCGGRALGRHATRAGGWHALSWRFRRAGDELHALGCDPALSAEIGDSVPVPAKGGRQQSMAEMLASMARIVEARNPGKLCSILLVDPEQNCVSVGAGPSLPAEYNAAVEGLEIGPEVGSCGTAAFWNVPVVVEDIMRDPLWRDLRGAARIAGVAACWSHPIRATDGTVLGAMALYDTVPSAPVRHEMDGLAIAAQMVGLAVERERLETQLRQAAKMEALGALAGGVAHDFNNLLSIIVGNAEMAQQEAAGNAALCEMLDDVLAASNNAAELCAQMLAYAGRSALMPEPVDCGAIVGELSKLLQLSLSKKATLRCELEDGLIVSADRSQLRQVILNLITNGAEAVGNRAGEVTVTTRAVAIGTPSGCKEMVEIRVADTGCGMSAATRARVFDPYFSTKAEGHGLGLAAVRGIVDAHGWEIRVESSPGNGSTFSVLAPRIAAVPAAARDKSSPAGSVAARVLVVDDEPGVLQVVTRMLQRLGMVALPETSGAAAIELYRRQADAIDVVLLDLNMPELDGGEVFVRLKEIRPDVRVILTSGFAEQELLDRFRGAGLAGVLQKPVRMQDLLAKLDGLVRHFESPA